MLYETTLSFSITLGVPRSVLFDNLNIGNFLLDPLFLIQIKMIVDIMNVFLAHEFNNIDFLYFVIL